MLIDLYSYHTKMLKHKVLDLHNLLRLAGGCFAGRLAACKLFNQCTHEAYP